MQEPILESGAVELLCGLTQSENPALRVNGIWALMMITVDFPLFLQHIDKIMSTHGKQIMQAVTLILEGEHNIEVKEQGHSHVKLQLAAMFCISNLIWNEEEGSQERQDKLRDMGIVDILHKLSQSPDSNLCDNLLRTFTKLMIGVVKEASSVPAQRKTLLQGSGCTHPVWLS
ncbi:armadillo repeat-containing protein 8-like [Leptonychotes weddellii]|uniref:Armadillo repeat-containing protein 8-like n=1 Tax=Leptonychotes weddellii TaxID=9713 RepID=A0A7F8RDT6_LEPWE|nr:armadillo repeat-containing protein 8-like [Leptonychotes weddellii]